MGSGELLEKIFLEDEIKVRDKRKETKSKYKKLNTLKKNKKIKQSDFKE